MVERTSFRICAAAIQGSTTVMHQRSALHRCTGSPLGNKQPAEKATVHESTISLPSIPPSTSKQKARMLPSISTLSVLLLLLPILTMASQTTPTITRIACFRFKETVTAEQKGDRARAFLSLYAQHQDLILGMPRGGKPLNTPLNLTNVKRDSVWDTGFVVTFKVRLNCMRDCGFLMRGMC